MTMKNFAYLIVLACASLGCGGALAAGNPPADAKAAAAKPHAAEAQQEVAYADLGKYLGKRVIVHTKLNTTRDGVLTRHSNSEIDLKLPTGAELSIPADTIRRVTVPIAPPDPLFQTPASQKPGDGSAKKN